MGCFFRVALPCNHKRPMLPVLALCASKQHGDLAALLSGVKGALDAKHRGRVLDYVRQLVKDGAAQHFRVKQLFCSGEQLPRHARDGCLIRLGYVLPSFLPAVALAAGLRWLSPARPAFARASGLKCSSGRYGLRHVRRP